MNTPVKVEKKVIFAAAIPALDHAEAPEMARRELNLFLELCESLTGDDWQQPTACTLWTVRDMLAHQAGAYAGYASFAEFRRQMAASMKKEEGEEDIDAINRYQLAQRIDCSPAELIRELREVGPKAIENRHKLPWLLRKLRVVPDPHLGKWTIQYMLDVIYPRDTWSHRLDICRATNRPFQQTAVHDGHLLALVVRDLAQKLAGKLNGRSFILDLDGEAGGCFQIGTAAEPAASIEMDVIQFNRLASDRITAEQVKSEGFVIISGDQNFASKVLSQFSVTY